MDAVIFDLDGTLVDSAPDIHGVANAVLEEAGAGAITLAQTRSFIGEGAGVFVSRIMGATALCETPEAHARLLAAFVARYDRAVGLTRLYPGVVPALEVLAARGLALGLCTNKPHRPAMSVLRHFGLDGIFKVVIGGDSLSVRKPDPLPLRRVMGDLGAARAVFVGDSEVDAATGAAAGVPFALFTEGYRHSPIEAIPHDRAFSDFDTLPGLISALL